MADLLLSSNSDRHPAEVAALRGSRAVIAEELDRGRHWRSALMKQITGEPEVTSRLLYQNPMTFERRWKTIIMANYKPKVDDNSPAFWDRMVLIKFIHTIPASKRNPEFLNNPGTELAGVLNWALDGFEAFQAHGLGEPPEVTEAVETYRHEADTLTTFINEACYVAEGQSTLATPLWAAYKAWTEERGVERLSADSFRAEMANQGFPSKHMNRGTCYQGLTLRSDVRREVEQ
jgi:putative DNA primase/helicase